VAVYSIKDLEKLSGIKAHTIRIWEQRYQIIEPGRTQTNIRYYTDDNLKLLLNIALLNKNGIKISKIAKMDDEEILEKVAAISEINFENDVQLDALTLSMIEMDEYKFDRIISTNIQQSINPVQENFMSYLIRQKIISAINNEPIAQGKAIPKFLIYLPEGESQELSLLFMHYLLKSRKFKVVYIGNYISLTDLKDAYQIHRPEFIYTIISETFTKPLVKDYVDNLATTFPETQILLSGYQVVSQKVQSDKNYSVLADLAETIAFLDELGRK